MRLSSGECLKFVQIALLYKLDVIYPKSISNDVSIPSAEKITLVDMYPESRYKDFYYWLGKLSAAFKPYECKVFSVSIQKSSRFFNRSVVKSLSILILSSCSIKVNLAC